MSCLSGRWWVLLAGGGFAAFENRQVSGYGEGGSVVGAVADEHGWVRRGGAGIDGWLVSSVLLVSRFALMALVTVSSASLFVREEELPDEVAEREFKARADAAFTELGQWIQALDTRLEGHCCVGRSREPVAISSSAGRVQHAL